MLVLPATLDPLVTDIVIPSAAILISTLIALLVVGLQLRASKRERRSEAIARVAEAISHLIAETSRKRAGAKLDLEPAMSRFDATIVQWRLAAKRRHRVVVASIRDTLFMAYLNRPDELESVAWSTRSYMEQWALGYIPLREFRRYAAWGGAAWPWQQRTLTHAWHALLAQARESQTSDVGFVESEIMLLELRSNHEPLMAHLDSWRQTVYRWWYRR